jgi:clan AA aspartic protease (TIGR02281 family)
MSAFDVGKQHPGALAQVVHDVPAGTKRAARLQNFVVTGLRRARSGVAVVVPMILLFTCVAVFAASDREDCAGAENPDQKIASCSRVIADDTESAPNRAQAYSNRGAAYYNKGDFDRAIIDFSEAVKIDPNIGVPYFALAYSRRGLASAEKKDYEHAIVDYGEAIKLNPTSIELYKDRGNAYSSKNDYDRAIADFSEAIKLDPNYAIAYNNRGFAYFRKSDFDRAIVDYDEAVKRNPNYALAYNNRGNAYFRKSDYDRAISDYSEAIRRNSNYPVAYDNRGFAYAQKNDYDHALADYDEAVRRNPRLASAYAHRGVLYQAKGDYDRSIADLTEAIARDSSYVYAYDRRCSTHYSKRNYDAAIADCSEAIRLNPNDDAALSTRSFVYAAKRDYNAALTDGNEAIRVNPKSGSGYNSRGNAHSAKREYEAAIADFSEAIRLSPKMVAVYGNRGNIYRNQGNLDLAIADFDQAIEINRKYFQAYNYRGLVYAARGDHNRAISEYTEAINLDPVYVEAYVNRGLAYEALGLTANATSDFRRAQSIDPSDQVSKARLAVIPPQASQAVAGADGGADTTVDIAAIRAAMSRLAIALPMDIAGTGPVKKPLDDLNREPCDQQAVLALGLALDKIGRKREAANALLSFSKACGGHAPSLKMAVNMLLALSDYTGAATAATELINLNPHDDGNFYLRATAYDRGGSSRKAIDDYLTAVELFANKAAMSSDSYLAAARNYEKLGQLCDARSIVEAWVALNPARNDSARTQAIIADYNAKGKCEAANSRAEELFRRPPNNAVLKLPVVINGVRGTFIMDTGATFVSLNRAFAEKAKVQIDRESTIKLHTANGDADGKRGHAATIQLRSLLAKDVVVVVQSGPFGPGVDGLLGLSFLSRFKVSIDPQTVKIANRNAK